MNLRTLVPSALAITLVAPVARAQQWPTADPSYSATDPSLATGPEVFGSPGQIVVSSDFDADISYSKGSEADKATTSIRIAPALMFFLARNLAVGGLLDFSYRSSDPVSATTFRVGPLIGYNIPLGPRSSVLPTLGLTYLWNSEDRDVAGGQMSRSGHAVTLIGRVPVLFHPFPHVFVGLAPYVSFGLTSEVEEVDASKERTFGVTLELGFWL